VGASLAMPDIHWGYGFAIGGVAAFDLEEGVVSPGGVGYDINCGVRSGRIYGGPTWATAPAIIADTPCPPVSARTEATCS
jgi:hypothetical protein